MRWPWTRSNPMVGDDDLRITIRIQWGLARITLASSDDAPRMWIHGVAIGASVVRRDGPGEFEDTHVLAIAAPIRLSPGGRFDDAWRPSAFALDDGMLHRPVFSARASVSAHRRHPVTIQPTVHVVDEFMWADGRYELIEGTPLWRETHEPPERTS